MTGHRVYINIDSGSNPRFHIPWNYHLSIQSFIYDALNEYEPELATKLHQSPYAPPWSYSNFIQTGPFNATRDGLTCERGYFVISSPNLKILNAVANYARHNQELKVGHTTIPVTNVEVEPFEGKSGEQTIKTLSPIAISERSTETPRDWYQPNDPMWFSRLKENIKERMEYISENGLPEDFKFKLNSVEWTESKLKKVSEGAEIPCTRLTFKIEMDKATSEFIQTHGMGEKTGMGFGNVMAYEDIPNWWS